MPSTPYRFSCHTIHDLDLIRWLDSFTSQERGLAIKAAVRAYMELEERDTLEANTALNTNQIDRLEDKLSDIFHEIQELKNKQFTTVANNDIMNKDIGDDFGDAEKNISRLIGD